jgi:hypothetical protein
MRMKIKSRQVIVQSLRNFRIKICGRRDGQKDINSQLCVYLEMLSQDAGICLEVKGSNFEVIL